MMGDVELRYEKWIEWKWIIIDDIGFHPSTHYLRPLGLARADSPLNIKQKMILDLRPDTI